MSYSNTQKKIEIEKLDEKENLTVLIVDEREAGNILERDIAHLGHRVFLAECYSDALQKVSENHCDLIVMDIDLPDGNGIEIISRIRELVGDINIVTMTDSNNREMEQGVRDQRILYYAVKPLEFKEIHSIIDHLLSKKKAIT